MKKIDLSYRLKEIFGDYEKDIKINWIDDVDETIEEKKDYELDLIYKYYKINIIDKDKSYYDESKIYFCEIKSECYLFPCNFKIKCEVDTFNKAIYMFYYFLNKLGEFK